MKEILLTQGKVALVDDEDFDFLNQWKWYAGNGGYMWYARKADPNDWRKKTYMHRIIVNAKKGDIIDHINMDTLDNRKDNLRLVTKTQNMQNRDKPINNKSGYKGVSWFKRDKKWESYITFNSKRIHIGKFLEIKDAALAYNEAAKKYFGEFTRLNIIK